MKTVSVTVRSSKLPVEKVWDLITDIEKYPGRVKFVKDVTLYGAPSEGSHWDDVTTILWVPLKIQHTIRSFKKNKEYSFDIPLSFGGRMRQEYRLVKEDNNSVQVNGTISYDLGNKIINKSVGPLLNRRLKDMLESAIQYLQGEVL